MQTVVFVMYHGMGHFNACLRAAKILFKQYQVVFAGHPSFQNYLEAQGFMYYPLHTVPFGMGFENWVNKQTKQKNIYLSSLTDRWRDTCYHRREAELHQLLLDLSPEYLLIDAYQASDFLVLYPMIHEQDVRVGFIQTMLSTKISDTTPPINSLVLPDDREGIKKAVRNFRFKKLRARLLQSVLYLGMSDQAIIRRRIRKNQLPVNYQSSATPLRGPVFANIPELVLAPKEFDVEQVTSNDHRYYVGFLLDNDRIEISDREYFKIDSVIRKKLQQSEHSLIYCSFGTVKMTDASAVTAFLQKLVNTVRDAECIVVISIHSITERNSFHDIPDNVYFLKAVPQLEILKQADVFITHGGLNSIKESIHAGVPMLVYPLQAYTDTMGNSSRVVYHHLGLRGDLVNDQEDDIGRKIEALINDDHFRENIAKLRKTDEMYGEKFLEHFQKLTRV